MYAGQERQKSRFRPFPLPEDAPQWREIGAQLDDDDHARVVERQVNQLDRQTLDELYRGVGVLAFDPVAMLKMVLYQLLQGNHSPARWFREAKRNDAMQWLGRGYQPGRRTWYEFRDRVGAVIERLHEQLIRRALDVDLLDPSIAAQDGSSVAACASRHRMVNEKTLNKRRELLQSVIEGTWDAKDGLPGWMPTTESGRLDLAERMKTAAKTLAQRIAENAAKPSGKRKDPAKIVVSLSDPLAPFGRDKMKVYRPLYTIQYLIAPGSHLIISYQCEPVVSDVGSLIPMIDKAQSIVHGLLRTVLGDAAYCSILDLRDCRERNIQLISPVQANSFTESKKRKNTDAQIPREEFTWNEDEQTYYCPAGHRLTYKGRESRARHGDRKLWQYRYQCSVSHCQACPLMNQCLRKGVQCRTIKRLEGQELLDAQRETMAQQDSKALYRLRNQTVERGFADAKGNRRWDRFHGRGPQRARTETGLMVLAHNALILDRLERKRLNSSDFKT